MLHLQAWWKLSTLIRVKAKNNRQTEKQFNNNPLKLHNKSCFTYHTDKTANHIKRSM